jgi:hypothetical protein
VIVERPPKESWEDYARRLEQENHKLRAINREERAMLEAELKLQPQLIEGLEWALSIIDDYFKQTGKIGFAESLVYTAQKKLVQKCRKETSG